MANPIDQYRGAEAESGREPHYSTPNGLWLNFAPLLLWGATDLR